METPIGNIEKWEAINVACDEIFLHSHLKKRGFFVTYIPGFDNPYVISKKEGGLNTLSCWKVAEKLDNRNYVAFDQPSFSWLGEKVRNVDTDEILTIEAIAKFQDSGLYYLLLSNNKKYIFEYMYQHFLFEDTKTPFGKENIV